MRQTRIALSRTYAVEPRRARRSAKAQPNFGISRARHQIVPAIVADACSLSLGSSRYFAPFAVSNCIVPAKLRPFSPRITPITRINAGKPDDRSELRPAEPGLVASIGLDASRPDEGSNRFDPPGPECANDGPATAGPKLARSSAALVWYPRHPWNPRSKTQGRFVN